MRSQRPRNVRAFDGDRFSSLCGASISGEKTWPLLFAHTYVNGDDDEAQWVKLNGYGNGRQEKAVRTTSGDLSRRAPSSFFSGPGVLGDLNL